MNEILVELVKKHSKELPFVLSKLKDLDEEFGNNIEESSFTKDFLNLYNRK